MCYNVKALQGKDRQGSLSLSVQSSGLKLVAHRDHLCNYIASYNSTLRIKEALSFCSQKDLESRKWSQEREREWVSKLEVEGGGGYHTDVVERNDGSPRFLQRRPRPTTTVATATASYNNNC